LRGILREVEAEIEALERDSILDEEARFSARVEALDRIEFHILYRIDRLTGAGKGSPALAALARRARTLRDRLEAVDEAMFRRLRAGIRSRTLTSADLLRLLQEHRRSASRARIPKAPGYDTLDLFVAGLIYVDPPPQPTRPPEPEMVFYQPTPARVVLELVERVEIHRDDCFYDLGSGLGHVPILVHLLTGVTAVGVEVEPAYCAYARHCAVQLGLARVEFLNLDIRQADYGDGTIFFMYTPCEGRMMGQVLSRLRQATRGRYVSVCTYGPCTPQVAEQDWLVPLLQAIGGEEGPGVFRSTG
jgi:hypothetical protein